MMGLWWWRAVVAGLVLAAGEAAALPFIALDPRANAMGGAGVAAGRSSNAIFVNPALLLKYEQHRAGVSVPLVAMSRFIDPKSLVDEIALYQDDKLEPIFETALANFKADSTLPLARTNLNTASGNLINQLNRFSERPIEDEVGAGFAVNVPGRKVALMVGQRTIGGGLLVDAAVDHATYTDVQEALDNNLPATDEAFNVIVSGPNRTLQTRLLGRGATIMEVGLALAREVQIGGRKVALGVTPKYVDVTTFDYVEDVNIASFKTDAGLQQYTSFNVDLGLAAEYGAGWSWGAAIKNLIPRDYGTALGGSVSIAPQLRAGAAYSRAPFIVALDLDLNEGRAAGYETNTQYLGMGGEIALSKTLHLRGGYRYNISDSNTSAVTVGMGLDLFGATTDIATSLSEDEFGLSAQLVFHF